jgi:hypothetical protein
VERVLEAGPIPYCCIVLYEDPDLEHRLQHYGLEPEATSYRLIELPVPNITDTRSRPTGSGTGASLTRCWRVSICHLWWSSDTRMATVGGCSMESAARTPSSNSGFRMRVPTS